MCSSQSPWDVNATLAYGFAVVNIAGGSEASWCSACYALKFTSGAVVGKTLVVQTTNTGGDLGSNQFDLAIPGGEVGISNGCKQQWGAPSGGWGAQYGGISDRSVCATFPPALQAGCEWRFDWFEGVVNPTVEFEQVQCPEEIVAGTGSQRSDDGSMPAFGVERTKAVSSSVIKDFFYLDGKDRILAHQSCGRFSCFITQHHHQTRFSLTTNHQFNNSRLPVPRQTRMTCSIRISSQCCNFR
jgi:hypothetical protein